MDHGEDIFLELCPASEMAVTWRAALTVLRIFQGYGTFSLTNHDFCNWAQPLCWLSRGYSVPTMLRIFQGYGPRHANPNTPVTFILWGASCCIFQG